MSLPIWLHRLGEHSVLLLAVMPLVGAVLVICAARSGREVARRITLVNAGFTVAAALLMLWFGHRAPSSDGAAAPVSRLVVRMPWLLLPASGRDAAADDQSSSALAAPESETRRGIEFAVGVDGLSLWPAAVTAFAVWGLLFVPGQSDQRPGALALLLLCEATLIGVFVARDVVLLCTCLSAAAILTPLAAGLLGAEGRRGSARRLMFQKMAGTGLFTLGLAGCVAAQAIMAGMPQQTPQPPLWDIDALTAAIRELSSGSPLAGVVWRQLSPWIFIALFGGCVLTAGVFPVQAALTAAHGRAGVQGRVLMHVGSVGVGGYLLLRFVIALCAGMCVLLAPALIALAFGGMVFTATWMQRENSWSRTAAGAASILFGLILSGALTFTAAGLRSAGLLLSSVCLALPLLQLAASGGPIDLAPQPDSDHSDGVRTERRGWGLIPRVGFAASAAALVPGLLLATIALAELDAWFLGGWLISTALLWGIALLGGVACLRALDGVSHPDLAAAFAGSSCVALLPLIVAAAGIAVFPELALNNIDAALLQLVGMAPPEGS